MKTTAVPGRVEVDLDEAAYPRDAVYAAAFGFIDRCWVRLDRPADGRLSVVLRTKSAGSLDPEALAAELRNELLAQTFRQRLADAGRDLTEAVIRGAYGGVDSPAIDDLLAAGTPPEDPLGLALQFEAQQGSGSPEKEAPVRSQNEQETEGEQGT